MIFITGSTGLVGSHLTLELLKRGNKIKALKREHSNLSNLRKVFGYYSSEADELFSQIEWVEGSLTDKKFISDVIKDADEVYHTAAFVSFSPKDKRKILEYNIEGTANIVNACLEHKVNKACFVSSIAALGHPNTHGKIDEECIWKSAKNHSVYSLSKFKAEMEVWRGITEGLNAVIVNPSIIIGPGEWTRSSCRLFNEIWNGMKFYSKGITGYVDVANVVQCIVMLMDQNAYGERYVISENNYSFQNIFDMIAESLNKKKPSIHANKTLSRIGYISNSIYSKLTGKAPVLTKETIEAGFNKKYYSNKKVTDKLNIEFSPIKESIEKYAKFFLQEKTKTLDE